MPFMCRHNAKKSKEKPTLVLVSSQTFQNAPQFTMKLVKPLVLFGTSHIDTKLTKSYHFVLFVFFILELNFASVSVVLFKI